MGNCAIFIDGGYLSKILENDFRGQRLDYKNFISMLTHFSGAFRLRTYYYDCMPYQNNEEGRQKYANKSKFIHALNRGVPRFEFRKGRLRRSSSGRYEQKGIDVLLGIDMVRLCSKGQIRVVVLVTGDSDLVPAVQACKDEGAIVQLYYSSRSASDELLNVCDGLYEINEDLLNKTNTTAFIG